MTLSRKLASFLLLTASAGLLASGCTHAQKVATRQEPALPADVSARLEQVQNRVWILDGASWDLPATTDRANRAQVAACFAELSAILPLIEGDGPSSEFHVGIRVLRDAQKRLAAARPNQPAEPIITSGLQATERLLNQLNQSHFDNDAALAKQLEALRAKVGELDTTHDAMNRVYAAQALRNAASILEHMSASLLERSGVETKPAAKKADAAAN